MHIQPDVPSGARGMNLDWTFITLFMRAAKALARLRIIMRMLVSTVAARRCDNSLVYGLDFLSQKYTHR